MSGDYRARALCAYEQFRLLRTLEPVVPLLVGIEIGTQKGELTTKQVVEQLTTFVQLPTEQIDDVVDAVCDACEENTYEGWQRVRTPPSLPTIVSLATLVIINNFGPLYGLKRNTWLPSLSAGLSYAPARMADGEDWLWRPVLEGVFRGTELYDGTVRIEQIAKANDALDVREENKARAHAAAAKR